MFRSTLLSATTSLLVVASPCGPAVDMLYSLTTLPTSHVLIPDSEIDIDTEPTVLREFIRSAIRPPQPVRESWPGSDVCHWTTWSLWEKSCGGRGTLPATYWARVIGWRRVPTLHWMAICPPSKSCWSSVQAGCRP